MEYENIIDGVPHLLFGIASIILGMKIDLIVGRSKINSKGLDDNAMDKKMEDKKV